MSQTAIPQTDSIKELAHFWDTHDLTDFTDELEEVSEPVFERQDGEDLRIHLRAKESEAFKHIARSKGMEQAELVRQWVLEKTKKH